MEKMYQALKLAEQGFWVFRLRPNGKLPAFKGWQMEATRDPKVIMRLFSGDKEYNIGIFTSKFGADKALIVIDEDNKGEKKGAETLFQLDFAGNDVPNTRVQTTPTGGRHHIYVCDRPLKQGANVLGDGLDIRSRGGYIVAAGSSLGDAEYTSNDNEIEAAPEWLVTRLATPAVKEKQEIDTSKIDPERALERAMRYLDDAPIAEEGSRNDTAFKVICELKDRGVSESACLELAMEWNESNEPPLDFEELEITVGSAYKTGQNAVGIKAAEAIFAPVELVQTKAIEGEIIPPGDWFDQMNREYAFAITGGGHVILRETKDYEGNYKLDYINEPTFHKLNAHKTVVISKKPEFQSKVWLCDKEARRYDGIVFAPEQKISPKFFNLWRGFTVAAATDADVFPEIAHQAVKDYLDHALNNVCNGNLDHFNFLMCHFAHLFQKPWQKPLTALVFKGSKGVGKNALINPIKALLGRHALLAAKKRFLTGQFNSHFESCLCFILDEAVWGGDKDAEGGMKDLITGDEHNIERKGLEAYSVKNITRIYIIGNEDWLVPASDDERRYGVFNVNDNKKQKTEFFESIRIGMEAGGLRLLLRHFLDYDINVNINVAPQTQGLVDQKVASLSLTGQWWLDCLSNNELLGAGVTEVNFCAININTFRNAYKNYLTTRRVQSRMPDDRTIGKEMKKYAPSLKRFKTISAGYEYRSSGLAALRKDFETYIKGEIKWPTTEEDDPFQ